MSENLRGDFLTSTVVASVREALGFFEEINQTVHGTILKTEV